MLVRAKQAWDLSLQAVYAWSDDNAFLLSAAVAYYAVFSLAPLIVVAIALAGMIFGEELARAEILAQIEALIGAAGAEAVQGLIESAMTAEARGVASVIGLVTLLFGATLLLVSLQDGLDRVWRVKLKPANFVLGFLRRRLTTLPLVLGVGFLLLVSLVVSAVITAIGRFFDTEFFRPEVWQTANFFISLGIITVLFAMIFKLLPNVHIAWSDVWIGAFVTAVLFSIGKSLIGYYLGRSAFTSVYGAAGSLVLILAWVYWSSLILFLGAEFTRVYANRYGRRIRPKAWAEPLTPEECAQEGIGPSEPRQSDLPRSAA